MTRQEIMQQLSDWGNESTKRILMKHGAPEPFFGVKVADLKKIQKKVKKDHELSLELYDTGNSDAMYLAGLIADEKQISRAQLQKWVENATYYMISEYTVAWIAAETSFGWELGLEWIESDIEKIASAGWSTLANVLLITEDEHLDMAKIGQLLEHIGKELHDAPNRVRYTMNGFVIAVGCAVPPLSEEAGKIGAALGKVNVDVGGTACKVPDAVTYIEKARKAGRLGKKKKQARC